tara:strand:- start:850 stop:1029 length:180 start_codon:yes stop_codon:yes gene_type:complete
MLTPRLASRSAISCGVETIIPPDSGILCQRGIHMEWDSRETDIENEEKGGNNNERIEVV